MNYHKKKIVADIIAGYTLALLVAWIIYRALTL